MAYTEEIIGEFGAIGLKDVYALEISHHCCLILRKHRLVLFFTPSLMDFFDAELQIFDIVGFQGEEWEMDL